jgi:hypothetical protein
MPSTTTTAPKASKSAPKTDEALDLSSLIISAVGRVMGDTVKVHLVYDEHYRVNWWTVDGIRQSKFLRVKQNKEGLDITDLTKVNTEKS